jgi:hypothetical protein
MAVTQCRFCKKCFFGSEGDKCPHCGRKKEVFDDMDMPDIFKDIFGGGFGNPKST